MKKNDLMTGDIVVMKSGLLGVVIRNSKDDYLMYQNSGWESLDDYDDDMNWVYDSDDDSDKVMQVFRNEYGAIGFNDFEDIDPIYERDYTWVRPISEEEAKAKEEARARYAAQNKTSSVIDTDNRNGLISIITQAFYGNRTGTEINKNEVDRFILGHLDDFPFDDPIDRSIIHLPGSDKLVLVYNKFAERDELKRKEELWKTEGYTLKPLAQIPELGLEIYSRCIVCRLSPNGEFESLGKGDFDIWDRYLAY